MVRVWRCNLTFLERQVIGRTFSCGLLSWREWRCGISTAHRLLWRERRGLGSTSNGRHYSTTLNVEGTNLVEPTTIILMSIDIERYGDVLTHLDVELLDTVLTENAEHTFLGILTWYFDNILL